MNAGDRSEPGSGATGRREMAALFAGLPYPYINLVADPSACVRPSFTVITSDPT
jgi:hypothetical protein